MTRPAVHRKDLIEPNLSYEIVGAIFDVYSGLGPGLKESTYQKALAQELQDRHLRFQEQLHCPITFKDRIIGRRYLDFLVEDKIVVELKCGTRIIRPYILQVKEYLTLRNLQLAIVAAFSADGVFFKRIINIS